MKIRSLLFAVASLLSLADATARPSAETSPSGPTAATTFAARTPNAANCDLYCHQPWLKCLNDCGGSDGCGHYCNCQYFQNTQLFCRRAGCVKDPGACPSPNPASLAGLPPHLEDVQLADVEVSVKTARSDVPAMVNIGNIEAQVPNPCVVCETANKSCKNKCKDDACRDACNCYQKQHNANCKDCGIHCNSIKERGVESTVTSGSGDDDPKGNNCWPCIGDLLSCKRNCDTQPCKDGCECYNHYHNPSCAGCDVGCASSKQRRFDVPSQQNDVSATVDLPLDMEGSLIDKSKETAGRSDASLTIDRLETNNQSPVIEPPQAVDGASFEGSKDVEIFSPLGSRSLELHCFKCADIIHACERKCATRGACRQPCLCFYRNIKKCHKCPVNCNCVHVCPRWSFDILSDEQRQLDNGSEIDDESLTISPREAVDSSQAVDPPDATYDSLVDDQSGISEEHNAAHGIAGVPIPFEPCVYCSYSINACKKMCATPGACDQVCVCYNDSHNRNCARCSLLCNREHIGPRVSLSLAQRRFDNRLEQNDKSAVDKQPEAEDQFLIGTAANGGGA